MLKAFGIHSRARSISISRSRSSSSSYYYSIWQWCKVSPCQYIYIRHPKTSWTFHHPEILELLVLERKCPANSRKTCKTFQKCHLDQTFRFHLKLWNQSYWVKFRKILHEQGPNGWIYIYDRSHQLLPCLITILIYGNQQTTHFRLNGKNFLKARKGLRLI